MTWVGLVVAAVFLIAGVLRALHAPADLSEALIDTAIGLGALALGVAELTRGRAPVVLVGFGALGLGVGLALLLRRRLQLRRSRRPGP